MKPIHIIAFLVIAIAIGVIVSTQGDASTYVDFTQAQAMANEGNGEKIHVVGALKKADDGTPIMLFEPQVDANYFAFTLVDDKNKACEVVYYQPKPQDFERSEKIVVIGAMKGEKFIADKILMKCPSKYQENKLEVPANKEVKASL